jgi:hypothetical protein
LILSKCVGGIVLVSSIGESSRDAIGHFKKSITNVNGKILGCVVNKVDFNRKYGYGGYYKSYQSYATLWVGPASNRIAGVSDLDFREKQIAGLLFNCRIYSACFSSLSFYSSFWMRSSSRNKWHLCLHCPTL